MNASPGELVVCVSRDVIVCHKAGGGRVSHRGGQAPPVNSVRRVIGTGVSVGSCRCKTLLLDDGSVGHNRRFRRLNDEPDDAELIALIKRPVRKGVSA